MKKLLVRWLRRAVGFVLIAGVVALVVVAAMPKPVVCDLARVARGTLRVTVDEDGRTRVKDRYVVSAPIAGNLARIELAPGDRVTAGQILARILPMALDERSRAQAEAQLAAARASASQAVATVARAQTAAALARTEASRLQGLRERSIVSTQEAERVSFEARGRREELASARFGARVAAHQVEMAMAALGQQEPVKRGRGRRGRHPAPAQRRSEEMQLTAPIDGAVLRVVQESEGVIQPGTPLVEVGDASALEIVADVLTADAVRIRPGAHVSIERWGGPTALRARVRTVEPSAFTRMSALGIEEQRVNVVIDLDDPQELWRALGDGYRVEVRIIVSQEDHVLIVPESAVFRRGSGWAAYKVVGGKARLVRVRIGQRSGLDVEILAGLREGDRVIVHPSDRVENGVAITGAR